MKIAGVLAGLIITAAVVYFLFLKPKTATGAAPSSNSIASDTSGDGFAPKPNQPIESPRTKQDEIRQEFSQKRLPFYRFLRNNFADAIIHFGVTESIDTLDVQIAKDDDAIMKRVVSEAVGPSAKEYGFRKVRFYVANPKGSVQPVTLIAESALDDSGNWNTFKK